MSTWLDISDLSGKQLTLAKSISQWMHDKFEGFVDDFDSGCPLFFKEYTYCFSTSDGKLHSRKSNAFLHLVWDGGLAYDMLSPNGDAAHMGSNLPWKLQTFIEEQGYLCEEVDNICLAIYKEDE